MFDEAAILTFQGQQARALSSRQIAPRSASTYSQAGKNAKAIMALLAQAGFMQGQATDVILDSAIGCLPVEDAELLGNMIDMFWLDRFRNWGGGVPKSFRVGSLVVTVVQFPETWLVQTSERMMLSGRPKAVLARSRGGLD